MIQRSLEDLWNSAGALWDELAEAAGDVWEGLVGGEDEGETITSLEAPSGYWTITDQMALIRRGPPGLSSRGKSHVIPYASFVEILDAVQKGSKQYVKVQQAWTEIGPPQLYGWTSASNIATLPKLKPKPSAAGPTSGGGGGKREVPEIPTGGVEDLDEAMTKYGHLFTDLPASDAELRLLMGELLKRGADLRIEYHSYNYKNPKPLPVTHMIFVHRHKDKDPLTSLDDGKGKKYAAIINTWGKVAEAMGGWEATGVSEADWDEIKQIRDEIVYAFLRIILPKLQDPGALPESASTGEQIAHQAHDYLGVRYISAGQDTEKKPGMDCSGLVFRILKDLKLKWKRGSGGGGVGILRDSPNFQVVSDAQPGDLLFGQNDKGKWSHVGIYVGDGMAIHAPHTGRVVSKEPEDKRGWQERRRYVPTATEE